MVGRKKRKKKNNDQESETGKKKPRKQKKKKKRGTRKTRSGNLMINTEDASLLPSPHYITSQHSPLLPFRSTDSRSIFFLLNLKLIEFNFFLLFFGKRTTRSRKR